MGSKGRSNEWSPALRRPKLKNHKSKAGLGCLARFLTQIVLLCFWVVFPALVRGAEMRPVIVCLLLHGVLLCGTFSGLLPCFLSGFLTFHTALRIHMDTRDFTGFRPESLLVTSFATSHTAWSWKPDCGDVGMKKQWHRRRDRLTNRQTGIEWAVCTPVEDTYYEGQKFQPFFFFMYSTRSRHYLVLVGGISLGEGSRVTVSGS